MIFATNMLPVGLVKENHFQPYITDEIRDIEKEIKSAFNIAYSTSLEADWKVYNNYKTIYQKVLQVAKNS